MLVTFVYGPLHVDVSLFADIQELIYITAVQTQDVVLRICRERRIIGTNGERATGKSLLSVRLDDDVIYHMYVCDKRDSENNWKESNRIYIIIIIIMSCCQHGYPWPSLAISPYHSSPPAGLQGYILCPHIVAVCKFELVVLLLHGHMWGSIGVHHFWARPCFSSSVLRVWFVLLVLFSWWGQVSV